MSEEYEMMVKIVLIGDSTVGKTNIMSKYLKGQFMESSKATIGVEFHSKIFNHEGHKINAQMWDTAGQEKYKSISASYFKGSKGAFIVYDITKKDTFDSIEKWLNELKLNGDPGIVTFIIGNKNDLEEFRQVSKEEGEEKAKSFQCGFLETSALSGDNIDLAFELMIGQIYDKYSKSSNNEEIIISSNGQDLNLEKVDNKKQKKGCC